MYWDYCYYSLAAAALQLTACSGYSSTVTWQVARQHVLTFGILSRGLFLLSACNENYSSKIRVEAIYGENSIKECHDKRERRDLESEKGRERGEKLYVHASLQLISDQ